ncbi:hypothetical protein BU25DRAFT_413635 [Macroventuria anomochaeta]|uniref:Uncharacterized protein n=1 Tax=Macroventuria anomochaeta TaxID=301207 RepID=A0ACB6RRR2_9PLEO|nr:uncharacterized protein BU25DRAFT_413635 [Macroventuria anomochaeta]KAF2624392.1 hypothetical protein BU25DRAFT_413635 [Macroventuria anomochaeta]
MCLSWLSPWLPCLLFEFFAMGRGLRPRLTYSSVIARTTRLSLPQPQAYATLHNLERAAASKRNLPAKAKCTDSGCQPSSKPCKCVHRVVDLQ